MHILLSPSLHIIATWYILTHISETIYNIMWNNVRPVNVWSESELSENLHRCVKPKIPVIVPSREMHPENSLNGQILKISLTDVFKPLKTPRAKYANKNIYINLYPYTSGLSFPFSALDFLAGQQPA